MAVYDGLCNHFDPARTNGRSFYSYASSIAARSAVAEFKKLKIGRDVSIDSLEPEESLPEALSTPDPIYTRYRALAEEAAKKKVYYTVREALDLLTEEQRKIIDLRLILKYSPDDTASILKVSKNTVKEKLSRAVSALREICFTIASSEEMEGLSHAGTDVIRARLVKRNASK